MKRIWAFRNPIFLAFLFSFRGVSEVAVPADRIHAQT